MEWDIEPSEGKNLSPVGGAVICYYAMKHASKERGTEGFSLISVLYLIGGTGMIVLGFTEGILESNLTWSLLLIVGFLHVLMGIWAYSNKPDSEV